MDPGHASEPSSNIHAMQAVFFRFYFLLRLRIDSGRINMLSTSQQESSPTPSLDRIKLQEVKSFGPGPTRKRAVKNPFFPSNE